MSKQIIDEYSCFNSQIPKETWQDNIQKKKGEIRGRFNSS